MDMYSIMFYLFAFITVASAYAVVTARNIIYAAFSLMLTFFGVAGIYVLHGADFIAIVQLVVYVGGIMILLLFGVMLTNKITDAPLKTGVLQVLPASIVVGMFSGVLIASVTNVRWHILPLTEPVSSLVPLGKLLMNEYIIIFELLGILLLIALIGAASIARKLPEEKS